MTLQSYLKETGSRLKIQVRKKESKVGYVGDESRQRSCKGEVPEIFISVNHHFSAAYERKATTLEIFKIKIEISATGEETNSKAENEVN